MKSAYTEQWSEAQILSEVAEPVTAQLTGCGKFRYRIRSNRLLAFQLGNVKPVFAEPASVKPSLVKAKLWG